MLVTQATKSRKWCFTYFWDEEEEDPDLTVFDDWECDYLIVGRETCPATGREHLQGYVRFKSARARGGIARLMPAAHFEPCKGNEQQNIDYCSKEGRVILEQGQREAPREQGKRNDIITVRAMIVAGAGMHDVVMQCNSYQGIRVAETMLKYIETVRTWMPRVVWLWGPTGCGKSKWAFDRYPNAWVSGVDGRWFEGYDAHEEVIIDDFRSTWCPFHVLLRLLDRYPYRIEVKGASRQFLAKVIVITCPLPPAQAYAGRTAEDVRQLLRRIDTVIDPGLLAAIPQ